MQGGHNVFSFGNTCNIPVHIAVLLNLISYIDVTIKAKMIYTPCAIIFVTHMQWHDIRVSTICQKFYARKNVNLMLKLQTVSNPIHCMHCDSSANCV